jgi:hypothetical protein
MQHILLHFANYSPSVYEMAMLQWLKESYKPFMLFAFIFMTLLIKLIFIDKSRKRRSNLPPGPPTTHIFTKPYRQVWALDFLTTWTNSNSCGFIS